VDQILDKTRSPKLRSLADEGLEAQDMSGVQALASVIARSAQASAVFGEPVRQGSSVIVPVAKAVWGVVGGKGPQGERQGGGGGMHVVPVGFIHLENGRARFHPLRKSALIFGAIAILAGALMVGAQQLRLMRRDMQIDAKGQVFDRSALNDLQRERETAGP
jgi:uncharacterized spore protein YtfJ